MLPDDMMVGFWTDFPWWIGALFKLRDFFAKLVGLKTTESNSLKEFEQCIRTGGTYSFASVPAKNNHETVLLLTDKHLDAYVSIHIENQENHKTISLIARVNFKNKLFFHCPPFSRMCGEKLAQTDGE